jgi:hypothetical protein
MLDMEIVDVRNRRGISLADFRNIKWDPYKSFFVYTDKKSPFFSGNAEFEYRITVTPRQRDLHSLAAAIKTESKDISTNGFQIAPRFSMPSSGHFGLNREVRLSAVANPDFLVIFNDEIKRKIGFRLRPSTEKTAHLKNNIFITKGERVAHQGGNLPGEGFEIVVEPDSIHIKIADSRGSLYGSWALLSMMEKQDGEWRVPCGIYRDWPDVGTRGISV